MWSLVELVLGSSKRVEPTQFCLGVRGERDINGVLTNTWSSKMCGLNFVLFVGWCNSHLFGCCFPFSFEVGLTARRQCWGFRGRFKNISQNLTPLMLEYTCSKTCLFDDLTVNLMKPNYFECMFLSLNEAPFLMSSLFDLLYSPRSISWRRRTIAISSRGDRQFC